jgi:N-acetylmuramoyl-L-alanine amidase
MSIRNTLGLIVLIVIVYMTAAVSIQPLDASPAKKRGKKKFIIDYRKHLNKRFKKVVRKSTRYIIVHTSEAGRESTLRTLSHGKNVGRYRTIGGHANYAISRDGQVYRILHHLYRADHAGLSMWNGLEDLSSHSIGIELVGFHYGTITNAQYKSLSRLLDILQRMYKVPDKNVLTHSQVSYGHPNRWFKHPHRGRKRCALNFEREKAGLKGQWTYDPDVKSRRLVRDRHIYAMFYKNIGKRKSAPKANSTLLAKKTPVLKIPEVSDNSTDGKSENIQKVSNIISKDNTAWNIAGEDYDDSTTLYVLPNNTAVRGNRLGRRIGWSNIPTGTKVMLNQPMDLEKKKKGPVFLVTKEYSPWSFAGELYNKANTIYFLPGGRIVDGLKVADWDSVPIGTRMIIGYNGPFTIQATKGKTPWGIAGRAHNHPDTIYYIPSKGIVAGDQIRDFNDLPWGSMIFLKISN